MSEFYTSINHIPKKIENRIRGIFSKYEIDIDNASLVCSNEKSMLFRSSAGQRYIIKLERQPKEYNRCLLGWGSLLLKEASKIGKYIPNVLFHKELEAEWWIVGYEYVEGNTLRETLQKTNGLGRAQLLLSMGRMLRHIHNSGCFLTKDLDRVLLNCWKEYTKTFMLYVEKLFFDCKIPSSFYHIIKVGINQLDKLKTPLFTRFCHGDPSASNIIVKAKDHLVLIDWGHSKIAPPELDIVRLEYTSLKQKQNILDHRDYHEILSGYYHGSDIPMMSVYLRHTLLAYWFCVTLLNNYNLYVKHDITSDFEFFNSIARLANKIMDIFSSSR